MVHHADVEHHRHGENMNRSAHLGLDQLKTFNPGAVKDIIQKHRYYFTMFAFVRPGSPPIGNPNKQLQNSCKSKVPKVSRYSTCDRMGDLLYKRAYYRHHDP